MKKKEILQGIFVDYFGIVLVVLAGFIAIPFYLTFISKGEYGLWLAINSVVLMVGLADFATDQFLTTVTSNDEKFNSEEYADYLTSILIVKTISTLIVAGVSGVIFVLLNSLLNVEISLQQSAQLTFILAVLALACGIFINALPTILYARHHYSLVNANINICSIASIIGVYFLLKMGYGIIAFPLAMLISTALQGFIFLMILRLRYPNIKLKTKNFKFVGKSEILEYGTNFQALRWLYTFRTQYISIAISNLVGSASLAQYILTSRLAQLGPTFSAKFAQALFPSMVNLFDKGEVQKVAQLFIKASKVLTRVAIFSGIVLLALNKSFVAIWVGADKYAGDGALIIIVIYMMTYLAMAQFAIVIFASKKFEKWVYWGLIEVVSAIVFSYYFSIWLGLAGVVMGFVLASLPTQMYLFRIVLRQLELGALKFLEEIVRYSIKPNIIPFFAACTMTFLKIEANNWTNLIGFASFLLLLHLIFDIFIVLNSKGIGIKNKIADVLKV